MELRNAALVARVESLRAQLDRLRGRIDSLSAAVGRADPEGGGRIEAKPPTPLPSESTPESEAVRSSAVPTGQIHGVVVDRDTGEPIEAAQVYLEGTQIGALTDSTGRLRISSVPSGAYVLVAQRLQYRPARIDVNTSPPEGIAARFSMAEAVLVECGDVVGAPWSIRIAARDVLTGRAPEVPVTLRLTSGDQVWTETERAEDPYEHVSVAAGSGAGLFDVQVTAAGYAPWVRTGVELERDACGRTAPRSFDVWLLPRREE